MIRTIFIIISILSCFSLHAMEVIYLARSPQALLMGDAFTAFADDEFTLFYNPAALGKNNGAALTPFSPYFGMTDPLTGISKFQNMPSTADGIANRLLNFPINLSAGAVPTVKMSHFGFSLFLNQNTSMILRNQTNPTLDINYNYDRGFITGFAYNLGAGSFTTRQKKTKKTKNTVGERVSVGFSVKHITRQGLSGNYNLFSTSILNTISGGGASVGSIKKALGYSTGEAWGYDTGIEYSRTSGVSTFNAAFSILDIGGTRFDRTEGTGTVPKQRMYMNAGVGFKQDFGLFDYKLSADLHPFYGPVDFARQIHLGGMVGLPLIKLYGGFSEGYLSYGAGIDIWPFEITAGWYGVELGSKYRQQEGRRFIMYLSLFDFSLDL